MVEGTDPPDRIISKPPKVVARLVRGILAKIGVSAILVWFCGCSTFDLQDAYRLPLGESFARLPVAGGELSVGFPPETRLQTVGPIGAPVIPVAAQRNRSAELNLSVNLRLDADHEFAFPSAICVIDESGAKLCSNTVLVHAYALKGPLPWRHIEPFFGSHRPWYEPITPVDKDSQIDRARVYEHYGYAGEPAWGLFSVEMIYAVACRGTCPQSVTLETEDLIRIDGKESTRKTLTFRYARVRHYQPTANPGP